MALVKVVTLQIKATERFREIAVAFAFGLPAVHRGRIRETGKEIFANPVKRAAAFAGVRTYEIPLATAEVFRYAFEPNAIAN